MDSRYASLETSPANIIEKLAGQYESRVQGLEKAGLVFEGEIADSNGNTHKLPSAEDVRVILEKNSGLIHEKHGQGFTRLLLVPLGTPLQYYFDALSTTVDARRAAGGLFDSKGNRITREPHGTNVWVWDGLRGADEASKLVYFHSLFASDHRGGTKSELPPFKIVLVEDMLNIPLQGKGAAAGGTRNTVRRQLEGNRTPEESLEDVLWNQHYRGEVGFTPEIAITDAIVRLAEEGKVTGDESAAYHIGSYLPDDASKGLVTFMRFDPDDSRFEIGANEVTSREHAFGARTAVILN